MPHISGGTGTVFVEHHRSIELGSWSLDFDGTTIGTHAGSGRAAILKADPFWSLCAATRIVLNLGSYSWSWTNVVIQLRVGLIEFIMTGDPVIAQRAKESHVPRP